MLLTVVTRSLIMWSSVEPTYQWVRSQVPEFLIDEGEEFLPLPGRGGSRAGVGDQHVAPTTNSSKVSADVEGAGGRVDAPQHRSSSRVEDLDAATAASSGAIMSGTTARAASGAIMSGTTAWSHGTGLISTVQISRSFYEIFVLSRTHHEENYYKNLFCVECCVEWCRYYSEEQLGINFFCFVHSSIHWNKLKHHVSKSCEFLWGNRLCDLVR